MAVPGYQSSQQGSAERARNSRNVIRKRQPSANAETVYVVGFWRRAMALLLDVMVVTPVAAVVIYLASRATGIALPAELPSFDFLLDVALGAEPAFAMTIGLWCACFLLYMFVFQATSGRTLGMRIANLRVIDAYGDKPSIARCFFRTIGYGLGLITLGLGFLWVAFDREKRGLHDYLAGTYVAVFRMDETARRDVEKARAAESLS